MVPDTSITPKTSEGDLQQFFTSLCLLCPHGWPNPDFVPRPPFDPAAVTMPVGWVWGKSSLGDALDALEALESRERSQISTSQNSIHYTAMYSPTNPAQSLAIIPAISSINPK